jgi:hypothetical protein
MRPEDQIRQLLNPDFAVRRSAGQMIDEAKEPPFDPADSVPPDMLDGEPNATGYIRWKVIPSLAALRQGSLSGDQKPIECVNGCTLAF